MYKSPISHVNFMNKVLQEEIEQCVIFGRTITFRRVSGSFQCGQVVPRVVGGIDENYRVTTLIFKNMVFYPSVWRIMHYSRYSQFLQIFLIHIHYGI